MIIDKIYCINLDRRPDRWEQVKKEFAKHNLTVERFAGVEGRDFKKVYPADPGNCGCTLSHYFIIERAKLLGLDTVMIFECDAELHDNFNELLSVCFENLPSDWGMLYLGGSHREKPVYVNDHILKVSRTLTTHAYIINSSMFDAVIDTFKNLDQPVDCLYVELQKQFNVYVTNPPLAWQRGGFSDIVGRNMRYDWIKSNKQ
jgi:glycosyl transferase family 25